MLSSPIPPSKMLATLHSEFPPTEEWASSPLGRVGKHFAEHERDEVQAFRYDEDDHQLETIVHFMDFLKVPADRLPSKTPKATNCQLNFNNFVPAANAMAKSMSRCECRLLLFLAFLLTFNPSFRFCQ
jgi:hypothetical protein